MPVQQFSSSSSAGFLNTAASTYGQASGGPGGLTLASGGAAIGSLVGGPVGSVIGGVVGSVVSSIGGFLGGGQTAAQSNDWKYAAAGEVGQSAGLTADEVQALILWDLAQPRNAGLNYENFINYYRTRPADLRTLWSMYLAASFQAASPALPVGPIRQQSTGHSSQQSAFTVGQVQQFPTQASSLTAGQVLQAGANGALDAVSGLLLETPHGQKIVDKGALSFIKNNPLIVGGGSLMLGVLAALAATRGR
jgi:hypothetical protein